MPAGASKSSEKETRLEAITAELRAVESSLEKGRAEHIELSDRFNEVQGRYYELGAEVARVEQAIQHGKETRQNQQEELEKTEQAWNEVQAHIKFDGQRLEAACKRSDRKRARPGTRRATKADAFPTNHARPQNRQCRPGRPTGTLSIPAPMKHRRQPR